MAMAYSYGKPMIITAFIFALTLSTMMMNIVSVEARRLLQTNQPSVPNLPGNIPTTFPPLPSIPTNPINNAIPPLPNIPTNIPQFNIPPLPSNIPTNIPNIPQMNIPPLPSNIPTNVPKMSLPPLPFNMPSITSFPFFSPPPSSP